MLGHFDAKRPRRYVYSGSDRTLHTGDVCNKVELI